MSHTKTQFRLLSLLSILSILGLSISATVLTTSSTPVSAMCAATLDNGYFSRSKSTSAQSPWETEGQVNFPLINKESSPYKHYALVRNERGWNAIRQRVRLSKGSTYKLTANVRTSANLTDGYFGFRNAQQQPVSEIKFNNSNRNLTVVFRPQTDGYYYVFAGLWANSGDTWMQILNVNVTGGTCNDT
jgi:hypothetical protein